MIKGEKFSILAGGSFVGCLVLFLLFRIMFITNIDMHEGAYEVNRLSGTCSAVNTNGWYIRPPLVYSVYTIDLRPRQITLNANNRVLNAKLVRFNMRGLNKFIEWHGVGAGGVNCPLDEILKSYAFDNVNGADCPFLEVISEISPSHGTTNTIWRK